MAVNHGVYLRIHLVDFAVDEPFHEAVWPRFVDGGCVEHSGIDEVRWGGNQCRGNLPRHDEDVRLLGVADREVAERIEHPVRIQHEILPALAATELVTHDNEGYGML